ncbi:MULTISPECIES: hypothetical protein [Spirulina sp. CCY15215]|uniref:hypothetical protein n=1 Tax=Spirulina sp. CCY15215 TaxID=2767591 RepID=UPI001950C3AB|nr:hypothetical protein [Spirulina major]
MTTLQVIETAIKKLSDRDVRQLLEWLQTHVDDRWEKQMKADLEVGKLDRLIARAEADIEANTVKEIDEILYHS